MKPIVKVVCGIIWKGDKVFIARRKPEKHLGGYWEFPGGKLEDGEDPVKALERELHEELGMKVGDIQYFGQYEHEYDNFVIELTGYSCVFEEATYKIIDHDACIFVSFIEFDKFQIAPADRYFVKLLERENK